MSHEIQGVQMPSTTLIAGMSFRKLIVAGCLASALFALPFNLMPVLLGSLADKFSMNPQEIGVLGSSLVFGWLCGSTSTYFLAARFNWRIIVAAGMSLTILGYLVSNVVADLRFLNLSWFVAGLGTSIPFSIAIQLLGELGHQERLMGLKQGSEVLLGAVLLFVLPAFFISKWGYAGGAVGTAAVLLVGVTVLRNLPRHSTIHHPKAEIAKSPSRNKSAWVVLGAYAVFAAGQVGLWAFLERIGKDIDVVDQEMGIVLAILKVIGGLGALVAVTVGSRFGLRWPHLMALTCIVIGCFFLENAATVVPYAIGAWLWEFGFSLSQCYQMAAVPRIDKSGRLTVLVPAAAGLGAAFGPAIAGFLKTGESYLPILVFTVVCTAISASILYALMSPKRLQNVATAVSSSS